PHVFGRVAHVAGAALALSDQLHVESFDGGETSSTVAAAVVDLLTSTTLASGAGASGEPFPLLQAVLDVACTPSLFGGVAAPDVGDGVARRFPFARGLDVWSGATFTSPVAVSTCGIAASSSALVPHTMVWERSASHARDTALCYASVLRLVVRAAS